MAEPATFAIVGASLAGAKAAETLRAEGFDGRVVLFGAEEHLPYERPPLSKDYLQGRPEAPFVHPAEWYAEQDVDLRLGTRITALDRAAHEVETAVGERVRYTKLLLTTGSSVRRLADAVTLRTLDDSDRLRAAFRGGVRVVIVGAGWIGLEVAAAARAAGAEVTVLEQAAAPLLAVLGPEMAAVFARLHVEQGVDLRCGVKVRAVRPDAVLLDDGAVPADLVVAGIGVTPDADLARGAGITVDNGVVVDEHLRSSDPDVFAAGDVANAYHPFLRRHVRVEHWANAQNQPVVAAKAMLGQDVAYDRLPYFFTDQYDLGMEYTGLAEGELVVRGDLDGREFVAFWLRDGRLTAAMNVNVWTGVPEAAQRLIRAGTRLDAAKLADPEAPLESLDA
ncbi:MAG: FAD-dependent oxidoreductase [Pseudonocardia sp.]|nr:FAD-dependent oxidoreductase [Pseudonocardia sp.]